MEKEFQDILRAISDYHLTKDNMPATLFIGASTDSQVAIANFKGNPVVLAQAFGNQMERNPEFNRLMKSLFAAYLSQNPKEKEDFIRGLELAKNSPSLN